MRDINISRNAFPEEDCRIHPLGPQKNEDILTELQLSQITEFLYQYRKNWKEHVDRMSSDRIPKMVLKYQPKEKNLGSPLKRWKDSVL
jgi:hypothetical protein